MIVDSEKPRPVGGQVGKRDRGIPKPLGISPFHGLGSRRKLSWTLLYQSNPVMIESSEEGGLGV